ncbi:hypothetical protein M422DRAFT_257773 [Sphaerobolus stellatus SS14]|uniref:Unplaced genomic scaffold SPHSTscaffold_77, whole genome shotgun sequence n=1 Tax=Sphaerobolus stellatus (strain SS14) TaxID=990650 RepID=A0A0C9U8T8_SPHS4|nr:hypothetical protein M422DRAFT_257773 [Sphaerobolus stellatus SS14]
MRFASIIFSTVCVALLASSAEARPYPSPASELVLRQTTDPTDGCGQPSGRSCN